MSRAPGSAHLDAIETAWRAAWPVALADWSRFTKLADPRWCRDTADEKRENLSGSFAMIRLTDHAVVISLRQVAERKLEPFAREILAHEIGHHVFAPADLRDNARLQARIRAGLPTREAHTGLVANLYTDLLINDRLQRSAGLDMCGVYRVLNGDEAGDRLWQLYMRIYERLWRLPPGTLTPAGPDKALDVDADLGARVIRVYGNDWLRGAGRFAALLLPYLLQMPEPESARRRLPPWLDTEQAGAGDKVPDGLAEIDPEEGDEAIHPAEDESLTGVGDPAPRSRADTPTEGDAVRQGGRKNDYRDPSQYRELIRSLGVTVGDEELVRRYYRERALPYLVRFPVREKAEATDPLPEGLDTWDVGDSIHEVDWNESVIRSAQVIPGVTTLRRTYGTSPGSSPERVPVDLYVGIDCSGSMSNPKIVLSHPVLAGTVVALSALRAGARVMACLSGEPGRFSQTDGFVRSEREILATLTGYLGSGYAFGASRLDETFVGGPAPRRATHILVVSDQDMFHMLDSYPHGWDVARDAVRRAGGGGTFVLEIDPAAYAGQVQRMQQIGWSVHAVRTQEELLAFARAFSRARYDAARPGAAGVPRARRQPRDRP
jgi:hypothetical protein